MPSRCHAHSSASGATSYDIHTYTHIYIYVCTERDTHIHTQRERETERKERERLYQSMNIYLYARVGAKREVLNVQGAGWSSHVYLSNLDNVLKIHDMEQMSPSIDSNIAFR